MGGHVSVEREVSRGAFSSGTSSAHSVMAAYEVGPILLVEDDADSRQMLATVLEFTGRNVVTASNGMEAYNLAREHRPSLIILDLMMPVMTGEEFRRAQLANADIRRIPVLILSAHHDAQLIASRMKAAGCLMKPVDFEDLGRLVDQLAR